MGLHLCYELALPSDTPRRRVVELLTDLRARSERLPFDRVSEVRELSGDAARFRRGMDVWHDPWALFLLAAERLKVPGPPPDGMQVVSVPPEFAAGFVVLPGRRCEAAGFGFSRCPEVATVGDQTVPCLHPGWHWHYCCKTQYSSVVSEAHFLSCHLGLVEMLDTAAAMGIEVTVRDETGYHEHRDEARLLRTVHEWNELIARIAGRLSDATEAHPVRVVSPIFEHPRFEHLEGEG